VPKHKQPGTQIVGREDNYYPPGLNPVGECWRQSDEDAPGNKIHSTFREIKKNCQVFENEKTQVVIKYLCQ